MENNTWRFGVVANIAEYHIGTDKKEYKGTKPFTAGTKVYIDGKNWNKNNDTIGVIGLNRFGRIVYEWIPVDCLVNIRTQRIYKPSVLNILYFIEKYEGLICWGRTSADRKETKDFVNNWNK